MLNKAIDIIPGIGSQKAAILQKELGIIQVHDLIMTFPFRYIDKTQIYDIGSLVEDHSEVQIKGVLRRLSIEGQGRKKRLVGRLRDKTGSIELVWFKSINYLNSVLTIGQEYVAFGKPTEFNGRLSITHPEMELTSEENSQNIASSFVPVYPSTDVLKKKKIDSKIRAKWVKHTFSEISVNSLYENLPAHIVEKYRLISRNAALYFIHFPKSQKHLIQARRRLKFEELFFIQMKLLQLKSKRKDHIKGYVFDKVGVFFNRFFDEHLPFELTNAQKKVIKEIRIDLGSGKQMNRLLQGDVGSGKTIVALMSMLLTLDNNYQAALIAPTQILAQQHFDSISGYAEKLGLQIDFLSGSIKGKKRKVLLENLEEGKIHILVGTHAILENSVIFKNLGLAITDEQHRFGVKQRAKLWAKNLPSPPHILVMTATPIPRTLAMTLYGDLDISVIDELPPGRKPVTTIHRNENHRLRVFGLMKEEIGKGRQVYVIYPLIEESEALDLKNLQEGFEALSREFPKPEYQISVLHGKMKPNDKDFEMSRFVKNETQIMIATTVIEVGVNVPNATVMVIEETQRFGLSQLHQLRGRVGRGAAQSYCILMTGFKLTKEGRERVNTMVATNDGFKIAEADLKLRGPGNIEGTQQSGVLHLKIADLVNDTAVLQEARNSAKEILHKDPELTKLEHKKMKEYIDQFLKLGEGWSRIS